MFNALLSAGCIAGGIISSTFFDLQSRKANFYKNLPEYALMDIGDVISNPTQEMIEAAPRVWSEEHQEYLVQVPQEVQCAVTGITASLYHEIVPSVAAVQRRKNAEARISQRQSMELHAPHLIKDLEYDQTQDNIDPDSIAAQYKTNFQDESIQIDTSHQDIITEPLCLSNIVDTQVYDTLIERTPERRDKSGALVQEAQYSLKRTEKPHDEQEMGNLLRLVDPAERQFFDPRTHRYAPPFEFIKWKSEERMRRFRSRIGLPATISYEEKLEGSKPLLDRDGNTIDASTLLTTGVNRRYQVVEDPETTPLSLEQFMALPVTEAANHRQQLQLYREQMKHLPLDGDQFPDVFLTLRRDQLNSDMFLPHATHLSLTPNSELDKMITEGNLWAKVNKERLVGLKRDELAVPPLRHVTVLGELFRDYDDTIRLRSAWDPDTAIYIDPVVTYKTQWEYVHDLEKEANKFFYASVGLYTAGAYFGFKSLLSITNALSLRD